MSLGPFPIDISNRRVYRSVRLFIEDICVDLAESERSHQFCEVQRTAFEVESHEPDPQDSYDDKIQRHPKVDRKQFKSFLKNGRPPLGTVLVEFFTGEVGLVPEKELGLLHRTIDRGQEVKLRERTDLSGIVLGKRNRYDILPYTNASFGRALDDPFRGLSDNLVRLFKKFLRPDQSAVQSSRRDGSQQASLAGNQVGANGMDLDLAADTTLQDLPDDDDDMGMILEGMPRLDLHCGVYPPTNSVILYNFWLGVMHDAEDTLTIKLSNGCIIEVENDSNIRFEDPEGDEIRQIGVIVHVTDRAIAMSKVLQPPLKHETSNVGILLARTARVWHVDWITRCGGDSDFFREPAPVLSSRMIDMGMVKVLEKHDLPCRDDEDVFEHHDQDDFEFRDFVRIADSKIEEHRTRVLQDVSVEEDASQRDKQSELVKRVFTTNMFHIVRANKGCTVRWQDGTESEHFSEDLEAVIEISDENGFQPGDVVVDQYQKSSNSELVWRPSRIGVVQKIDPADRIATVLWQRCDELLLLLDTTSDQMFLHGDAITGLPIKSHESEEAVSSWTEEVPVYDIMPLPSLKLGKLDDFVAISWPKVEMISLNHERKNGGPGSCLCSTCHFYHAVTNQQTACVGRIMDNRLDGSTIIRFAGMDPVKDYALPVEVLSFALSLPEYELDQEEIAASAGDITRNNMELDSDDEHEDEEGGIETWIENEIGERMESVAGDEADESWDTVSEDSSVSYSDVSMHDSKNTQNQNDSKITASGNTRQPVVSGSHNDDVTDSAKSEPRKHPILSSDTSPLAYLLLDSHPPSDHKYILSETGTMSGARIKRITKEHGILSASLPEGVFVRGWESRLDLLRILMIGPSGTPYEHCPFLFDLQMGAGFPQEPPTAHFHSWTRGSGRVNPNLYEEGKICLSLLNTWFGEQKSEGWDSVQSTILQVIVSLLGLVLVKEPYYNEAGYDTRSGSAETISVSQNYSEKAFYSCRGFIRHAIENDIDPFDDIIKWLYISDEPGAPQLLRFVVDDLKLIVDNEVPSQRYAIGGLDKVSKGAVIVLRRRLQELEDLLQRMSA